MLASDHRPARSALVLCLLLTVARAAAAQQGRTAAEKAEAAAEYYATYRLANSSYAERRYANAAPLFAELVTRNPEDAALWFRLGRSRELIDEPVGAIEAYRSALDLGYRSTPWVAYRIARLFAGLARADSSFAWLERALKWGYDDRPGVANDPAFEPLGGDPRFARLTGQPPDRRLARDEGWRYDVDFLVAEAKRMHGVHGGPERAAFSAAFDSAATALRERIPDLSNDAIVVEMRRLMALLGDAHTAIYGAGPETPLRFEGESLPVLFYQFDDGVHIVNAVGDASRWIGARVLRFGSRPTDHLMRDLSHYVHRDNPVTPTWLGVHFYLRATAILESLGATRDFSQVTLTLRDRRGEEHRVTLEGGDYDFPRKLRTPANSSDPPPLYLRDVDRNYWLQPLPDASAVYWQFNQVRDMEEGPSIAAFADSLRETLERTGAENLIVDVRHNNGGNNGLLDPLLRTLVWWEQTAPGRRLFVITGRNTFSAAQNFINRVERWTDAIFVGEPSSSKPNFLGEETHVVLPFSRVHGSISTMYWQDSDPGDERRWIAPHVPVTLSSSDYFGNHDPAMAAVLRVIAEW